MKVASRMARQEFVWHKGRKIETYANRDRRIGAALRACWGWGVERKLTPDEFASRADSAPVGQ